MALPSTGCQVVGTASPEHNVMYVRLAKQEVGVQASTRRVMTAELNEVASLTFEDS